MDILDGFLEGPKLAAKRYRICAAIIDIIILWLVGCILAFIFGQSTREDGTFGFHLTGLPALLFMVIGFALIPLQEGATGKTIGKHLLKIKVMKEDNTSVDIGSSIVRHLFDLVDCIFLVGLIIASTNAKKQRIGDLVAKTIVVKD